MILAGDVQDGSSVKISTSEGSLSFHGKTIQPADEDKVEPV